MNEKVQEFPVLILDKFPTHIAKTDNKIKENKMWKINSQSIYNGSIMRFQRNIVVQNMHKYIISEISRQHYLKIHFPVQLYVVFLIPVNYSSVRRKKNGDISWNVPDPNFNPGYDEDNLTQIWVKCIKDSLTKIGVWPDDNVMYCRGTSTQIRFIDHIDKRQIRITFKRV